MEGCGDSANAVTRLRRRRKLRTDSTDAEALLWRQLRDKQVAGAKFRRQHQLGPFILDFYCAERRLALEIDGGQHFEQEQARADALRTSYLTERGIRVLRFTNLEVLQQTETVLAAIWEELGAAPPRGPSP